jgi:hypothetical protein
MNKSPQIKRAPAQAAYVRVKDIYSPATQLQATTTPSIPV